DPSKTRRRTTRDWGDAWGESGGRTGRVEGRRVVPPVRRHEPCRPRQPGAGPVGRGVPAPRPRASDPPAELHLLRGSHRAAAAGAGFLGRALGDAGRLTDEGTLSPRPSGKARRDPL